MRLFGRTPPTDERDYLPPPLEVTERGFAEDAPPRRIPVDWGEKPADLVRAAAGLSEWTRPAPQTTNTPSAPPELPWSCEPPTVAGLWFWRDIDTAIVRMAVVLRFGGSLTVRVRRGDSAAYVSVAALRRAWSGPCALPADVDLEALDVA